MTARTRITGLVTAVVTAAVGATAAPAAHGPGSVAASPSVEELLDARLGPKYISPDITGGFSVAPETPTPRSVEELQDARLGPKFYVAPSRAPSATAEPSIVEIPSAGFDWHDASIGAGVTAAALVAVAAAGVLATRHRHHPTPLRTGLR